MCSSWFIHWLLLRRWTLLLCCFCFSYLFNGKFFFYVNIHDGKKREREVENWNGFCRIKRRFLKWKYFFLTPSVWLFGYSEGIKRNEVAEIKAFKGFRRLCENCLKFRFVYITKFNEGRRALEWEMKNV